MPLMKDGTPVLVLLAMTASAAVDARALASEGPKAQWAPTRNFSSLNARDSANCLASSSPRKIELALRARDATSPSAVAKTTRDYLDYVNMDEMVRGTVGRPLFFTTAAAGGAGIGAGCAITPGCGAVALTAGAAGLAASPDPSAALMSPVRACGNALTSGAGDATAADAECGSALGGLMFGASTNSEFLSQTGQNAKLAFSPGALVLRRTPEGLVFLGLAENPAWVTGAESSLAATAPFVAMAAGDVDRTSPQLAWQAPKEATPTRYRWHNYFMKDGNKVSATLRDGVLSMVIKSPKQHPLKRSGSRMFQDVFDHFGLTRVREFAGEWVQNSNYADNYNEFASNLAKGMSEQDAAWSTWTGRQLKARGFTRVVVAHPEPGVVAPRFFRD